MGLTNYPNGLSSFGMPLVGITTGNVFFVHNGTGLNRYDGTDSAHPFNDLDYAIGRCSANQGDVIYCMPGHYEEVTAADAIDADVAGISIIGLGSGLDVPQIDYTETAAELVIGAASVTIENMNFHSNEPDVLIGIEIEAAGDNFTIRNCRFDVETTATDEFTSCITIETTANAGLIEGCYFDMGLGGAAQAIHLNDTSDGHVIRNNKIFGDYSTANIAGSTAASTNLQIGGNILINGTGGDMNGQPNIELNGNSTGLIYDNLLGGNTTLTTSMVGTLCLFFENWYNETISNTTTGAVGGTASADD